MIWAVDPGSSMGYALRHKGQVQYGTLNLYVPGKGIGQRGVRLIAQLNSLRDRYGVPDLIVYEQPHHRGGQSTRQLLGCVGVLETWAASHNVACDHVHTLTLKKAATGSGKADKTSMIAAARVILADPKGDRELNEHEADALCLLVHVERRDGGDDADI